MIKQCFDCQQCTRWNEETQCCPPIKAGYRVFENQSARDAIVERTASQIYRILEKRELSYREVLRALAGARSLAATNAKLN